ncbi:MAG TPA: hypothetical protein VIL77_08745 [Gaiellaceae bacterium]
MRRTGSSSLLRPPATRIAGVGLAATGRRFAVLLVGAALVLGPVTAAAQAAGLLPPVVTVTCAPAGPAGACSGWFTTNVTVTFSWTTPAGESFYGETGCNGFALTSDTAGQAYSCVVTLQDGNGNTVGNAPLTGSIKRDTTPPVVSGIAPSRAPDANGWYNHPVGVTASGSDPTSGIASCTSSTYGGPDSSSGTISGTCTDNAGNLSAPMSISLKYDATPPTVTSSPSRDPDANGWYSHAVGIAFAGSDSTSGVASCTSSTYSGPDTGGAAVAGSCTDQAGNVGSASFPLNYDSTPPSVTDATTDRPPDAGGIYNHTVVVTFAGSDAASGIASCDTVSYDKPDSRSANVTGVCRDNAGNVSTASSLSFVYDSTPPVLGSLSSYPIDDGVSLTWKLSSDVAGITVRRAAGRSAPKTVYAGKRSSTFVDKHLRNGVTYTYTVVATDKAGNTATVKTTTRPSALLLGPRRQARVHGPVALRWRPMAHTGYYNVQLWRGAAKVLSVWPSVTSYDVGAVWTYSGRTYRLSPGRYTWFVWPGRGSKAKHAFGPLLGSSSFVVTG